MKKITTEIVQTSTLRQSQIDKICAVLKTAYPNSKMPVDFLSGLSITPQISILAHDQENGEIVGFRTMKPYNGAIPAPIINDHANIYGKHLCILPEYRGSGIGSRMISELNKAAYEHFNTSVIWGGSAEVGALRLYKKMGALFLEKSILNNNPKISLESNKTCFKAFIETPALKTWRLQNDIGFAYANDDDTKQQLLGSGFIEL